MNERGRGGWLRGPRALADWALENDAPEGEARWTTIVARVLLILVLLAGFFGAVIKLAFFR
jgi:hypothetical protein